MRKKIKSNTNDESRSTEDSVIINKLFDYFDPYNMHEILEHAGINTKKIPTQERLILLFIPYLFVLLPIEAKPETLSEIIVKYVLEMAKEKRIAASTVIGLFVKEKVQKYFRAYFKLFYSFLFILICYLLSGKDLNIFVLGLPVLFFILLLLNQKILEYRLRKRYTGKNEYEAREIIKFILAHSNKSDFMQGGKMKELFPQEEMQNILSGLMNQEEII